MIISPSGEQSQSPAQSQTVHEHKLNFVTKYIFSQDHKMIAKQYIITGIIWAIIGGAMSLVFRLQLAYPDRSFPWLEDIFGHWAPGGRIQPEFYYALITMHGTVLVFFVLTAGLSGTFANLLIPLQVGARDMASPLLNMLSYWFFLLASIIMLISLFIQTGPASGGWTSYPPLSALGDASQGSKAGMDLWLAAMAIFVVSQLLGGLNYITTVLNLRTKGMGMTRLPLTIWALFFTAILSTLSFPVLLSGFVLLLFDRHAGTSFYLSDIFLASTGKALPNEGGSAILYQHLFWFLGHPEVYIVIMPAMGLVSEVISVNSRKPIFGYVAMIGFTFRHHGTCLPGLGAPHVRQWIEPLSGIGIRTADSADRGPLCDKSIQLADHALEGEHPLYAGHALCHRICQHVHFRRADGALSREFDP